MLVDNFTGHFSGKSDSDLLLLFCATEIASASLKTSGQENSDETRVQEIECPYFEHGLMEDLMTYFT